MMRLFALALGLAACLATPALAEPKLEGLGQALALLAVVALAYLSFAIWLLVLAWRRNWKTLKWVGGLGALVIVVYPLADMAILKYQTSRLDAAEIRQDPVDLANRTILFISPNKRCNYNLCEALIKLRGGAPVYRLSAESVANRDLTQPIDLSTADLRRHVVAPEGLDTYLLEEVDPSTPRPVFDYVIIDRQPYFKSRWSNLEDALPGMPRGTLLGGKLTVQSLAAPLISTTLELPQLIPDYLTFYTPRKAFNVPLFFENTLSGARLGYANNIARAEWFCAKAPTQQAQFECSRAIRP